MIDASEKPNDPPDKRPPALPNSPRAVQIVRKLKATGRRHSRKMLFLYHPEVWGLNLEMMRLAFELAPCRLSDSQTSDGWQVLIERPAPAGLCIPPRDEESSLRGES